MLFLNQWKGKNGRRNIFMAKSSRKNVPDVGVEVSLQHVIVDSLATNRASAPGMTNGVILPRLV